MFGHVLLLRRRVRRHYPVHIDVGVDDKNVVAPWMNRATASNRTRIGRIWTASERIAKWRPTAFSSFALVKGRRGGGVQADARIRDTDTIRRPTLSFYGGTWPRFTTPCTHSERHAPMMIIICRCQRDFSQHYKCRKKLRSLKKKWCNIRIIRSVWKRYVSRVRVGSEILRSLGCACSNLKMQPLQFRYYFVPVNYILIYNKEFDILTYDNQNNIYYFANLLQNFIYVFKY